MIRNSHRPTTTTTEICTNQLLPIPIHGKWIWDELRKELVYQSENPIHKKKDITHQPLKIDLRTGLITYRKQNRSFQPINKTKDDNKITLNDVIEASLNVMSELFYIPIEFEEYLRMAPVREYFLYLLNYFYWFFRTMNNASPEPNRQIDRSNREKTRIQFAYAHLLATLRELNCKYAGLLLGIDLKDFHHMRNGELFRADTEIELLNVPFVEEERLDNRTLIDCKELFVQSMAKKVTMASPKFSIEHSSSIIWNDEETSSQPKRQQWQRSSTEDAHQFGERSPLYRRKHQRLISQRENRMRGILTKQLRSRNQSLTDEHHHHFKKDHEISVQTKAEDLEKKIQERAKLKQKRLILQQLHNPSSFKNLSLLSAPDNPLDDSRIMNRKQWPLPNVEFQLRENLGIIGQPCVNFDFIHLKLKPHEEDAIIIPKEFLVPSLNAM